MRLVLDTNVLVAALVARCFCAELLEHCAQQHEIILSPHILSELKRVLGRKFRFSNDEVVSAVALIGQKAELANPERFPKPVCRDKDDDLVLGTALAGHCDCIVTGDPDLLVLKKFKGIPILSPRDFWKFEGK